MCFATVFSGNTLWDPKGPSASVTVCRLGGLHALVNVMSMSDRVIQYGEPGSDGVNVRTIPDGSDHPKLFTSSMTLHGICAQKPVYYFPTFSRPLRRNSARTTSHEGSCILARTNTLFRVTRNLELGGSCVSGSVPQIRDAFLGACDSPNTPLELVFAG